MKRRFLKIFIPFIVLGVCQIVCRYIFITDYSVVEHLESFMETHRSFIFLWFPTILSIFYLLFFVAFRIHTYIHTWALLLLITLCVIAISAYLYDTNFGDWWYKSNLCFPIGLWYAYIEPQINRMNDKYKMILIALLTIVLLGLAQYTRKAYTPVTWMIIYLFPIFFVGCSYFVKVPQPVKKSRVLSFLSDISYELFLIHVIYLAFLPKSMPSMGFYVSLLVLSIGTAYLAHKFFMWIFAKLKIV